jgi:hypothetical protein
MTQRSEAWARRKGLVIQRSIWLKVIKEAEVALAKAHANGFVPCDENCMGSLSDECNCHCGGANHSIHAAMVG